MMKLFELFIENNLHYEDYNYENKLIVASGQQEADIRAENWMKDRFPSGYERPSFKATEITEVDGFKITVSR